MDDIFNKLLKYLIMSLISFMSILFVPSTTIKTSEGLMITFIISIFYAILDRVLPSITYKHESDSSKSK